MNRSSGRFIGRCVPGSLSVIALLTCSISVSSQALAQGGAKPSPATTRPVQAGQPSADVVNSLLNQPGSRLDLSLKSEENPDERRNRLELEKAKLQSKLRMQEYAVLFVAIITALIMVFCTVVIGFSNDADSKKAAWSLLLAVFTALLGFLGGGKFLQTE